MSLFVICDEHLGGVHQLKTISKRVGSNVFPAGDNHDLMGCLKSEVPKYQALNEEYKKLHGNNYIGGNHEGGYFRSDIKYVECLDKRTGKTVMVLITHNDIPLWGIKKAAKYRGQELGRSSVGRFFTKLWNKYRDGSGPKKWKKKQLKKLSKYANARGGDVMIGGHIHASRLLDETYNGVRCCGCVRGETEFKEYEVLRVLQ